jgi:Domain of unknown function (DUF5067)
MSMPPPGFKEPKQSPSSAPSRAVTPSRKDAKADAAASSAYAKALRPWYAKKRAWGAGLAMLLVLGIALLSGGGSDDPQPTVADSSAQSGPKEPAAPAVAASDAQDGPSFKNGVLKTPELEIRITRHKVINVGAKGNEYGKKPVIAFYYETTNLTGGDVNPSDFLFNFKAFQDTNPNAVNKLEVGSLPDDRFLDTQMETIKQGGTVENAVAYELDDLSTPVELAAVDGLDSVYAKTAYSLK